MSQANLRNIANNPFLYLETTKGSTAIGTDASGADDIVKIVTGLTSNIDPTSADGSISIETTTPGDIQFRPNGIGQSTFINGNVEILADSGSDGNLLMQDTTVGGVSGVINYGGDRFIHNYGTNNTFVGELAGNFSSTGTENTAVGTNSLNSNSTAVGHTAIGFNALTALTSGIQNTAVGYSALASATSANQNTAVGYESLRDLTSPGIGGGLNAAYGNGSLRASTLGRFNTALGCQALVHQNGNGNNDIYNTAVGCEAGWSITSGRNNTLVGAQAGVATLLGSGLLTGENNVIIGAHAGENYTGAETSNVLISNAGTVGESLAIHIGTQGTHTTARIAGVASTAITATGVVGVSSSGQLGGSNGSNGQLLVGGGTGPVWANITSTDGSITVTNGANTINVATTAQPGITWSQVTGTTQAAAANAGYIANNAGLVTVTLLAAASSGIGTKLRVTGMNNATGWKIAQNASQQIFFGTASTTAGVGGSLASTATRDSVELVCISADGLFWNVLSSVGNITVT